MEHTTQASCTVLTSGTSTKISLTNSTDKLLVQVLVVTALKLVFA